MLPMLWYKSRYSHFQALLSKPELSVKMYGTFLVLLGPNQP